MNIEDLHKGDGYSCSFCGKSCTNVSKIIAGATGCICDECTRICAVDMLGPDASDALVSICFEILAYLSDALAGRLNDEGRRRSSELHDALLKALRRYALFKTVKGARQ